MQAWLTEAITVSKGGNSEWLPRKGPTHYRKTQIPPDEYEQLFTQVTNRVGFPGHVLSFPPPLAQSCLPGPCVGVLFSASTRRDIFVPHCAGVTAHRGVARSALGGYFTS
jgi:hypothetical protein